MVDSLKTEVEDMPAVLLLTTVRSYRLEPFRRAAERLNVPVITAIDLPPQLSDQWPNALSIEFADLETATQTIVDIAKNRPLAAVLAVDDRGSLLAAAASEALGLAHNPPASARAARDKSEMRRLLQTSPVLSPNFAKYSLDNDPGNIVSQVKFPCVVKPLNLNGSRGVIRANNAAELGEALMRLRYLLSDELGQVPEVLIEDYIPGIEVAVEAIIDNSRVQVLAVFDKPDPLDGPFFEETIYVTPSRLNSADQDAIVGATATAAAALGLVTGPMHAELRLNVDGPWIVEIAARSIGGMCSEILRFGIDESLEDLIVRQAVGMPLEWNTLGDQASGVMMIPIPAAGILRGVDGIDQAAAVPLVEKVEITARENYPLVPLPEGDSYPGFIFARGDTPEAVESALRQAHQQLHFEIEPLLVLQPV